MRSLSLDYDDLTHNGIPFFDVRIQNCVNCNLYNLHLVVVPCFDRLTAENTVNLIKPLSDSVCEAWQNEIISITTNSERTNNAWQNGVFARLARMAAHNLMRIWCAYHQRNIMIRAATNEMDNGVF